MNTSSSSSSGRSVPSGRSARGPVIDRFTSSGTTLGWARAIRRNACAVRRRAVSQSTLILAVAIAVPPVGDDEFGDDVFDDQVEQGVLVGGVAVDPHRVAIQGLPEAAHRERFHPVLVDDLQGGGQYLVPGQRGGASRRRWPRPGGSARCRWASILLSYVEQHSIRCIASLSTYV